jgi:hypothetical protein
MPASDYAYAPEAWRVIVLIRPHLESDVIQQLPSPYMPIEKAEVAVNEIRVVVAGGGTAPVTLPWLAADPTSVIGAYLTA